MPGDLILNSLDIQRFRCFRELRIERLGRVNLIVGKNSVGKSTILDALRLFAKPGSLAELLEIFTARSEVLSADLEEWSSSHIPSVPVDSLFFGRTAAPGEEHAISIGPIASPSETLRIILQVSIAQPTPPIHPHGPEKDFIHKITPQLYFGVQSLWFRVGSAARVVMAGIKSLEKLGLIPHSPNAIPPDSESLMLPIRDIPLYPVGPNSLSPNTVVRLWDDVSLSSLEADVIDALRIISPEVERVAVKGRGDRIRRNFQGQDSDDRVPFVKVEGFDDPIPLRALGDGVNRLFGLALALVSAKGGLLLVDEIENGIHYSVQADLWRLIFETAARRNVQVFATTHSYDCIKAFEEAARESEEEGVLVRLARRGDRTLVGQFDERELEVAIEGDIEVR
jgi:hypothetical protein